MLGIEDLESADEISDTSVHTSVHGDDDDDDDGSDDDGEGGYGMGRKVILDISDIIDPSPHDNDDDDDDDDDDDAESVASVATISTAASSPPASHPPVSHHNPTSTPTEGVGVQTEVEAYLRPIHGNVMPTTDALFTSERHKIGMDKARAALANEPPLVTRSVVAPEILAQVAGYLPNVAASEALFSRQLAVIKNNIHTARYLAERETSLRPAASHPYTTLSDTKAFLAQARQERKAKRQARRAARDQCKGGGKGKGKGKAKGKGKGKGKAKGKGKGKRKRNDKKANGSSPHPDRKRRKPIS